MADRPPPDAGLGEAEPTPVALEAAVARVGDRWSLLVVDALLAGPQRFGDLAERVGRVAPNVLSRRLRDLEAAGVIVAEPYSTRPLRHEYRLTPLGRELAPALAALAAWGARLAEAGSEAPGPDGLVPADDASSPGEDELHYL